MSKKDCRFGVGDKVLVIGGKYKYRIGEVIWNYGNYSKETKADFLGLGNYIYLNHYKKWKKIKDNFDLKNIVVKLEVNNNLLRNENTNEGTRKVHE